MSSSGISTSRARSLFLLCLKGIFPGRHRNDNIYKYILHRKAVGGLVSWCAGKRGRAETLSSEDIGSRGGRYVVGEAERGERGTGASLASVLCSFVVVKP